jgi:hypothetical protein
LILLLSGLILYFFPGLLKYPGRLPGDIHLERNGFSFHFPWVTCLIFSLVISLILILFRK